MPRKLLKYEPPTNRITWFTTWNYAVRNYYSDDIDYIPAYPTGNDKNTAIVFVSLEPNMVTVDWGDGNTEQFSFYKCSDGKYRIYFRSLNIPYQKNPNSVHGGWSTPASGQSVVTVNPHHYADDRTDIQRTIIANFSAPLSDFSASAVVMTRMPILESPDLTSFYISNTRWIKDFVFDKLEASPNLTTLRVSKLTTVTTVPGRSTVIPDGILAMTNLKTLEIQDIFDFRDVESSGIRGISNLKKLNRLAISNNGIGKYLKEYNDLPNLTSLTFYDGYVRLAGKVQDNYCDYPIMDEVDKINPSLTKFEWIAGWDGGNGSFSDCWFESVSGKGLENIERFPNSLHNTVTPDHFPEYFKEMRACNYFSMVGLFKNQDWADMIPESLYTLMKGWENITMSSTAQDGKRNQFYGCQIQCHNSTNSDYGTYRPSGEYQAPVGFVEGISDGTPANPMEYVYVMVHNYNQKWIFIGETLSRASLRSGSAEQPVWALCGIYGRAVITDGEIKSKDDDIMKFDSFEEAAEEAFRQGLDISEYADNPYCDISHLLNRGGVVADYQQFIIREEVRHAA